MSDGPHLLLAYEDRIPAELFGQFRADVETDGLDFQLIERPSAGMYAGVQWMLPTAVILFVTRSYFDSFLKEMGKDHYQAFKKGVGKLRELMGLVKVTVFTSSPNKAPQGQRYSLVFSIYFEGPDGSTFKFLVPNEGEEAEKERAMEAFAQFLQTYYGGALAPEDIQFLQDGSPPSGTRLVAFNPRTSRIEAISARTEKFASDVQEDAP
jgi:hypothetical protein